MASCGLESPNLEFMAPEQIYNKSLSEKTDIWQVGIMMFFLTFGVFPFTDENSFVDEIKKFQISPNFPKKISKKLKNLLTKTLILDQSKRITLE